MPNRVVSQDEGELGSRACRNCCESRVSRRNQRAPARVRDAMRACAGPCSLHWLSPNRRAALQIGFGAATRSARMAATVRDYSRLCCRPRVTCQFCITTRPNNGHIERVSIHHRTLHTTLHRRLPDSIRIALANAPQPNPAPSLKPHPPQISAAHWCIIAERSITHKSAPLPARAHPAWQ